MDTRCTPWLTNGFVGAVFFGALLLTGCGGGGGSNYSPPPPVVTAAPSGLSYPTPQVFTIGQAITVLSPTVSGTVSSYSVSPALPTGLAISASTGAISGTPTAVAAQAKYTVTASNSSGATTADVMITVNDVKPTASYPSSKIALATGVTTTVLTPTTTGGGAVVSWSISPDLPAGLLFSTTDGSISGTPTAASPATAYTITATNSGGQSTAAVTISVQSGVLLELGHADEIAVLRFDGTHVLSADKHGHWVLWDYATGNNIAHGDSGCTQFLGNASSTHCASVPLADMAGPTIALLTPTGFQMRSSIDGHLLASIDSSSFSPNPLYWWALAADGSYITAGNSDGLKAWGAGGQALFSKAGDYSGARVFAAPAEIRVALGAAGAAVLETIAVPTGVSAISPQFQGTFKTWFADGARFLSVVGNTVLTYSSTAVQQDATAITHLGELVGSGTWFANLITSNTLEVYKVGASTTASASYPMPYSVDPVVASGTTFALLSAGYINIIDLSGPTPVEIDYAMPTGHSTAFAAASAAQWLAGNGSGVLLDGAGLPAAPRYFALGKALSIAGSINRVAVSTAAGRILYYDATSLSLQGSLPKFSGRLVLSTDSSVLAALGDSTDSTVRAYSLPSESVLNSWTFSGVPDARDISLSGSGTVLGQVLSDGSRVAYAVAGGGPIYSEPASVVGSQQTVSFLFSPDGSYIASPQGPAGATAGSNLVHNGTLVTAFNDTAIGWLDNGHLLANNYEYVYFGGLIVSKKFHGARIHDLTGAVLADSTLPDIHAIQPVSADTIYSPELNSILPVTTGAVVWSSGDDSSLGVGAVAGPNVVFASGTQVLALSR